MVFCERPAADAFMSMHMMRLRLRGVERVEEKQEHIRRLAAELLDDIELSRLTGRTLVLKAVRLARVSASDEIRKWLGYEISGYNSKESISLKYMTRTGRWIDREKQTGYWGPLAKHEATLEAMKVRLGTFTTQGLGGDGAPHAVLQIAHITKHLEIEIGRLSSIVERVVGSLHSFVAGVHYEALFSRTAAGIFEQFSAQVDPLLQAAAADLSDRMETSYVRLSEGDPEAISAALNTCRRVIDAFADAIYPPKDELIVINGETVDLGPSKHQNRINAFVAARTSGTRRKRLRQTLANLYHRVSVGVHDDVSASEAQALVLSTYMLLGEIALMRADPQLGNVSAVIEDLRPAEPVESSE